MSYNDWLKTFTHIEVIHLDSDTAKDEPSLLGQIGFNLCHNSNFAKNHFHKHIIKSNNQYIFVSRLYCHWNISSLKFLNLDENNYNCLVQYFYKTLISPHFFSFLDSLFFHFFHLNNFLNKFKTFFQAKFLGCFGYITAGGRRACRPVGAETTQVLKFVFADMILLVIFLYSQSSSSPWNPLLPTPRPDATLLFHL